MLPSAYNGFILRWHTTLNHPLKLDHPGWFWRLWQQVCTKRGLGIVNCKRTPRRSRLSQSTSQWYLLLLTTAAIIQLKIQLQIQTKDKHTNRNIFIPWLPTESVVKIMWYPLSNINFARQRRNRNQFWFLHQSQLGMEWWWSSWFWSCWLLVSSVRKRWQRHRYHRPWNLVVVMLMVTTQMHVF